MNDNVLVSSVAQFCSARYVFCMLESLRLTRPTETLTISVCYEQIVRIVKFCIFHIQMK